MNTSFKDPQHVFIMGCGDIGRRVAALWRRKGITITGYTRSSESLLAMTKSSIEGKQFDLDATPNANLNSIAVKESVLYYFAPPPASGKRDIRMAGFLSALRTMSAVPERIILISTSSVYGDHQGGWVTEQTQPSPMVDRAWRRLDAEQQLNTFCSEQSITLTILRVAGIYCASRLPVSRIKKKIPNLHEHLAPQTNRIHADDLAAVCFAAAQCGHKSAIYNVCDGNGSNMTDYFNQIADHLGLDRPPTIDWLEAERVLSEGMLSYLKESRRMDNRLMLEELGVNLRYPDLASGLKA